MGRRALFLDRDGTLMVDTGYVRDPADVKLLPGVVEGLRSARSLGYDLVVVSNQSGVARGIISEAQLAAVQARLEALLGEAGVELDLTAFCRHGPDDGCSCRKPAPGMLLDSARLRGIDLGRSVMVGDHLRDVAAGRAAGCTTILLGPADGASEGLADYVVQSFSAIPPILTSLTHA